MAANSTLTPVAPASIERVEAWTVDQAADVLSAASISSPSPLARRSAIRGTSNALGIPLDVDSSSPTAAKRTARIDVPAEYHRPQLESLRDTYSKRREPLRRDSLKRREALLKGKEGSRRRQRWENDRLLSNPYAEPPLPQDWEVRPTYPVQKVPYFLAPLWDAEYARRQNERDAKLRGGQAKSREEVEKEEVTRELKAKLKKAKAARGLLKDLEGEVRAFVEAWEKKQKQLETEGVIDMSEADTEGDSEDDDEIVFIGRNGGMSDEKRQLRQEQGLEKDKLVFQSLLDDHGANFGRYLVHAIAAYYNLKTWSITTGNPARREAYVGLREDSKSRKLSFTRTELPRPLWACV